MNTVIVYSTPSCPWCHKVKEYLTEKKVVFTDINVAEDEAKAQEMMDKSGQLAVPVVDINGKIIIGFDKPAIDLALNLS